MRLALGVKPTRVLPIPTGGEDSEAWVGVLALVFEADIVLVEVIATDIGTWEATRNYRKINLFWSK